MFGLKDHKTDYLIDPWRFLGEKRRKMLDQSWAGLFREHILNELPVQELLKHYSPDRGRPTKELFTMLGAVLLQQTFNLTDEQTVERLAFDVMWHYALDVTDESDQAKYRCQKTLWSMRQVCSQGNVDREIFNAVTAKLAEVFGVELDKQRLDSTHLHSNMRRLSHLGVFVEAISKFLKNLKRHHKQIFKALPKELRERYTRKKSLACFAQVKPSDSRKTLKLVADDLYHLVESFGENEQVYRWRAGVEATMSELDRLTGIKRLKVRGLVAVRYCVNLKACGLNILRASRVRRARIVSGPGLIGLLSLVFGLNFFIKELLGVFWSRVELNFLQPNPKSTPPTNSRRHLLMEAA